jgi:hypothetical protein
LPHLFEDLRQEAIDEFRRGHDLQGMILERLESLKVAFISCHQEVCLALDGGGKNREILRGNRMGKCTELLLPGQGDDLKIQEGKVPLIHGQHAGQLLFYISLDLHQVESTSAAGKKGEFEG